MALPPSNKAQEYVQQVCAQIRWKKAHPVVEEELLAHIEDQREAFLAEGMSAEEAEAQAVAEMGSPLETGSQFDRIYRPKMEWSIVLLVGVMLILGTVLRGRLLIAMGTGYAITDLWSIPIGLVFMMLGYWLDYTALLAGGNKRANRTAILYFCIVLGIAYGLNSYYDSARVERFLGYMALFCPLLFCSGLYVRQKTGVYGYWGEYLAILLYVWLFGQANARAALLVLGSCTILLLFALWKNWFNCSRWWGLSVILSPLLLSAFILAKPYRITRITAFLNPYADPMGEGYLPCKILDAVQSASLFGAGGTTLLTLRENLPSVSTNYLLTAALSWWGWFAIILILLAYVVLLAACYFACRKVKSTFGQMVVVAITSTWMIQILLYVITNFTAMQIGTYPLLFVQGNVAIVCNLFLLGLLLSVYKTGAVVKDEIAVQPKERTKINS